MRYETVHTIRDFWDGVRSGTANFNGAPHYFTCPFDDVADDYTDAFQLFPVSQFFMEREVQHWTIYRVWESKFHRGLVSLETHPGHGGIDANYDELGRWLDDQIEGLAAIATRQRATFRPVSGQEKTPAGMFRELEVCWSPKYD